MKKRYKSYQECVDFFYNAQKEHPNNFLVEVIGKTWEERDIIAVTISNDLEKRENKPMLLYSGTIHAREWIGVELAIGFAKYIIEHIEYNPILKDVLTCSSLLMIPCANPDGFEFSRTHYLFWRKNRRQNADGTFGVDLNRNFSVGFSPNKDTSSNIYSGPAPFSEPETLALKEFADKHSNITITLSYHSQGNVFFPAHNFKHEDAIDATDLNVLCANMAEEIRKVSNRKYGVHMGKPPSGLISGCEREYYYSQGALAITVEVGTRNISDYLENMTEHINEHISALVYALIETPNYNKIKRLPRVENFIATKVSWSKVELSWEYPEKKNVYFEIYRNKKEIGFCQASNRIGETKAKNFTDYHLDSSTNYTYFIRAVSKKQRIKSPFAPKLTIRTLNYINKFSKILFPIKEEIGYVGEKTLKNFEHFGINSLFVGISQARGECFGVIKFSLESVPQNAIITSTKISLYPSDRVNVQVENFGEWRIGMMDETVCKNLHSFNEIKNAPILSYIDRPTRSNHLTQGIWCTWEFAKHERLILQQSLKRNQVVFRMDGPTRLPIERLSQLMIWDIGYGKFSAGLEFRPKLEITYTLPCATLVLNSTNVSTISKTETIEDVLKVGFDKKGKTQYGHLEFNLENLPDIETTMLSSVYLEMDAFNIKANSNIRYHVEIINSSNGNREISEIEKREVIERIGYDVSVEDIKNGNTQRFVFDTQSILELINAAVENRKLTFFILPTSENSFESSQSIDWIDKKGTTPPRLIIEYIKKRRNGVEAVKNLTHLKENGKIKLTWDNPEDDAFRGVIVVKNPFHIPCSPYDGQKLYGGKDSFTYDSFGSLSVDKYYAVFTYDDVPNFSEPAFVFYNI
jgi:hypothetical protein